jgi:hypothetical protein
MLPLASDMLPVTCTSGPLSTCTHTWTAYVPWAVQLIAVEQVAAPAGIIQGFGVAEIDPLARLAVQVPGLLGILVSLLGINGGRVK